MLIHIFVDSVVFASVPKKTVTIVLNIDVETRNFELSAPLCDDVAANFCKTIHVPVTDDQTHTSDIKIAASAFTVEGITFPLGNCKYTFTSMEHGLTKKLYFASKKSPEAGNIVVTAFYYRFPMDIADFSMKDQSASERQQKYIREYTFLRSRRENWSGNRATTWNSQTQRLIDEDISVPLTKPKPRSGLSKTKSGSNDTKNVPRKRLAPKLRKTMMSVGYVGIHWPESGNKDNNEKIMLRLHIAEEKRLHMLKEAAERARRRNVVVDRKIRQIAEQKQSQGREAATLRALLHKKEEALVKLKVELEESERNRRAAAERKVAKGEERVVSNNRRSSRSGGRPSVQRTTGGSRPKHSSSATQTKCSSSRRSARFPKKRRAHSLDHAKEGSTSRRFPRSYSVDSAPIKYANRARSTTKISSGHKKKSSREIARHAVFADRDANALDLVVGRKTRLVADDDSSSLLIDVPSAREDFARKESTRKNIFLEKIRKFQDEKSWHEDNLALKELLVCDHPASTSNMPMRVSLGNKLDSTPHGRDNEESTARGPWQRSDDMLTDIDAIDVAIRALEGRVDNMVTFLGVNVTTPSSDTDRTPVLGATEQIKTDGLKAEAMLSGLQSRLEYIQRSIIATPGLVTESSPDHKDMSAVSPYNVWNQTVNTSGSSNIYDMWESEDDDDDGIWPLDGIPTHVPTAPD